MGGEIRIYSAKVQNYARKNRCSFEEAENRLKRVEEYGGEGSGNFGHEGRPGEVGGSRGGGEGGPVSKPHPVGDIVKGKVSDKSVAKLIELFEELDSKANADGISAAEEGNDDTYGFTPKDAEDEINHVLKDEKLDPKTMKELSKHISDQLNTTFQDGYMNG